VFRFLTRKPLWVNIVAVVLITAILIFIFLGSLDWITQHNQYAKVPSIVGKNVDEARRMLEAQGFEVEIQDSLYIDTVPKLAVVKQSPEGDATVKIHRTVYLTLNRAQPPMVEMPNLVGFSIRNAEMYLENLGLHVGDTTFRPDIAKNAVLEQLYNGEPVKAGTKVFMGSSISFVLGDGIGNTEMNVPDVIGKTYSEAKQILGSININITTIADADVTNQNSAYVYKQNPEEYTQLVPGEKSRNRIRAGQSMDIWLSTAPPVRDTTAVKPIVPPATPPEQPQ
jgi:eukaryotic-like serine/threonine-protein kinase